MKHRVRVETPHPNSMAAGVLLSRRLRKDELSDWFEFRSAFLDKVRQALGELRCHYCGRGGLVEEVSDEASKEELRHLATVDHVIPRSKGGPDKDEDNLVVACFPCNQRKADKLEVGAVAQFGRAHPSHG